MLASGSSVFLKAEAPSPHIWLVRDGHVDDSLRFLKFLCKDSGSGTSPLLNVYE